MIQETTALGAAYLAGLQAGVYPEPSKFADNWRLEHRFKPNMSAATRERKLKGWARAVKGVLASDEGEVAVNGRNKLLSSCPGLTRASILNFSRKEMDAGTSRKDRTS